MYNGLVLVSMNFYNNLRHNQYLRPLGIVLLLSAGMFGITGIASAQGLDLISQGSSDLLTPQNKQLLLIATRLILVLLLLVAGLFGLISGFNWLYWEGNATKAHDGKIKLSKAIFVVTVLFFLLVIYRVFIPDYAILSL